MPEILEELEISLVNYGIPDITAADLAARPDRERFRRRLRADPSRFRAAVQERSGRDARQRRPADRTLRFRIDALLHAEPAPEPVVFDSALEPATGNVEVKGAGR